VKINKKDYFIVVRKHHFHFLEA